MIQEEGSEPLNTALLPRTDLSTGEVLSPEQQMGLINYAKRYQLDPFRGHVLLMYGKPYISLDGYLYYARQTGRPYSLLSRPMSTDEAFIYRVGENDYAWIAEVKFHDTDEVYTGLGILTSDEMTAKSKKDNTKLASPVVAAHPWQLGQKRAEWQALRRAFPIGESEGE